MVDLLPSDEQDEIVSAIRSLLADRVPPERLHERDGAPDVVDAELWKTCAELGWFGLGVSEADGGVGYSVVEEALLCCELGASLAPGPWVAQLVAIHAALALGHADEAAALVGGEQRAAWFGPQSHDGARLLHHPQGAHVAVSIDGTDAGWWSTVPAGDALHSIDALTPLRRVGGSAATPTQVAAGRWERAALLLAATAAGIARATAEQSRQYSLDREQFGQPIGGFQAVKHRCADMATRADAAVQQVRYASVAFRDAHADAALQIAAAHQVSVWAALDNAEVNVQNHGGIGFTWEHSAHRYVTRAQVTRFMIDPSAVTAALLTT